MPEELPSAYNPKDVEARIYAEWMKRGFFEPKKTKKQENKKTKTYTILLPPPNITGSLHMGHTLNATIADILIRYHRMKGENAAWLPGIDHAGIAAQNVVEKQLRKENVSRFDLGREKFVEKVWEWKEKYGTIILDQLKRLGASCDWSHTRFTMDPTYSAWVTRAFIHYYEKGLIYRGKRVVNWCPRCQTSLSDLEVEYKEEPSKLYFIRYKIIGGSNIVVATTRPETLLGDAAVAVNPKDARYKKLVGKNVQLPLCNREIPIVADAAIEMSFGTGMVKVTPSHDMLDAEIAVRHSLPSYDIINGRGRMTEVAGEAYKGLKVAEAREKVVAALQSEGLIEKIEDYTHNVARCSRCDSVLEPLASDQWFLKMRELAKKSAAVVKSKKTQIVPKNFEKGFFSWLTNIKDWCISRQIWWGHRLPVWFHEPKCVPREGKDVSKCEEMIIAVEKPNCEHCGASFVQSEDVLDTWFSSALWPFAGLSEEDIKQYYPSDVLVTARDIINLWVGRMIFSGLEFFGKTPFATTLIHSTILAKDGRRMSKSLGTGVDPMDYVNAHGADATRFGVIWQSMGGQDIRWDEAAVVAGKKFANKIWNASRFVITRNANSKFETRNSKQAQNLKLKTSADKQILVALRKTKKLVERGIEKYEFGPALHIAYDFFWHDFCDVYIEATKTQQDENTNTILAYVLREVLKILHPFMPHVTEEIWQKLPHATESWLIVERW